MHARNNSRQPSDLASCPCFDLVQNYHPRAITDLQYSLHEVIQNAYAARAIIMTRSSGQRGCSRCYSTTEANEQYSKLFPKEQFSQYAPIPSASNFHCDWSSKESLALQFSSVDAKIKILWIYVQNNIHRIESFHTQPLLQAVSYAL